jgi:hypothetical protein
MNVILLIIILIQFLIVYFILTSKVEKYDYFGGGVITGGESVGQALEEVPGFGDYSNWENE